MHYNYKLVQVEHFAEYHQIKLSLLSVSPSVVMSTMYRASPVPDKIQHNFPHLFCNNVNYLHLKSGYRTLRNKDDDM